MNDFSTKLFANPSLIQGTASVLDLGATLEDYNTSVDENTADAKALSNDWQAVGNDIKKSIASYEESLRNTQK